jgi:hypothetical protein
MAGCVQWAILGLQVRRERSVSKMATKSSVATVGTVTVARPAAMVAAVVPEELPLELRLKRQREIIHARRGELKHFLSPRETPFKPLRTTFQTVGVVRPKVCSSSGEMVALQLRLQRQREIIHARRAGLKCLLGQ